MSGLPLRIISSSSARAASACSLENKKSHFGEGITADDMNKLRGGLDGARENQTTWKSSGPPRHNPRQFCLDVASGDLQLIGIRIIKANLAATARQHQRDP